MGDTGDSNMKIVVIGGSGLIGKKVVTNLRQHGHEVVAASPSSGVNTVTGEGLAQALAGAQVVVDVANAPSWEDKAVLEFFETSGRNLLAAEAAAGVGHHVALSVVGTDRLLASGYFRAKLAQEKLIKASPIPYTIVRATQFFEFVGGIAQSATEGQTVRLPPVLMQPIVSDDVAAVMADVALAEPLNGTFDLAGPESIRQDDLVRQFLNATGDARTVITDPKALYFGITVNDQSLTPGDHPRLGCKGSHVGFLPPSRHCRRGHRRWREDREPQLLGEGGQSRARAVTAHRRGVQPLLLCTGLSAGCPREITDRATGRLGGEGR